MRKQIKILLIVLNIILISMIGLIRTADKSDSVVYRGGIYLFLLAMITVILIKKQRFKVLASMMPILLYALALMISIPQEGSHYIMAFPLFAALFGVTSFMVASRESL